MTNFSQNYQRWAIKKKRQKWHIVLLENNTFFIQDSTVFILSGKICVVNLPFPLLKYSNPSFSSDIDDSRFWNHKVPASGRKPCFLGEQNRGVVEKDSQGQHSVKYVNKYFSHNVIKIRFQIMEASMYSLMTFLEFWEEGWGFMMWTGFQI